MIHVIRLDGNAIVLNAEQIQSVENTPDTMITMLNGSRWMVRNSVDEIIALFLEYKRKLGTEKLKGKT